MKTIGSVTVFCGTSNVVDEKYKEQARILGHLLAKSKMDLVYGGGQLGLMGLLANATLAGGGHVYGFIPDHLLAMEHGHPGLTKLEVVDSMHVRKQKMFDMGDAFILLPGGFGTLDESFEILTLRQLNLHTKPIIIVNVNKYWDPLLELIQNVVTEKFAKEDHLHYFTVVDDAESAMFHLLQVGHPPEETLAPITPHF